MFTINHQGGFFLLWNFFVTICCLISSYYYVALAAFRNSDDTDSNMLALVIVFECVFCIDIVINSMLSYERQDTASETIENNIVKTLTHYLTTNFYKDLIPVIPFQNIELENNRNQLFLLIKLMRLFKGFRILDEHVIMGKVKNIYKERAKKLIETEPKVANDTLNDHNKIQDLLLIYYILKITKLVIIILNFSYLFGMFWYIMIKLVEDLKGLDY